MLENTNLYLGKRIINVDSVALVTFVKDQFTILQIAAACRQSSVMYVASSRSAAGLQLDYRTANAMQPEQHK